MFGRKKRIIHLEQQIAMGNQAYAAAQQEIARLTAERDGLRAFFDTHGGREVWKHDTELDKVRKQIRDGRDEIQAQKETIEALKHIYEEKKAEAERDHEDVLRELSQKAEIIKRNHQDTVERLKKEKDDLQEQIRPLRIRVLEEEAGLEMFDHPAGDSIALGVELASVRKRVSALVRSQSVVTRLDATEEPRTKTSRQRQAKDTARLVLRAFNAEVQNIITSATAANYETSVGKIHKAAEAIAKLGKDSGTEISPEYIELRLRELRLAVDHLKAKKLEREIEREHRAEMREQAKAERELEAERERLEKEKQHYLNVLKVVETQGNEEEAARLQEQLVSIEKGINDVDYRVANIRAGYVYVISNIGSFGERMVKIGMTRRVDPMDRVKELGDASVPFGFDVHALFFSEDAVDVENRLHRYFADKRVNRVNTRREFFYATPAEVRDALKEIAGNLLEFTEEPAADQYRQSLHIAASTTDKTAATLGEAP
ncbi:DUF4041 domain-containing protein [Actinomyces wuliandei]|uniref:DUF4041 domain-containing protein n=1 Tax=Actinomyces wuliandei TaxID=2057743 RepID=UPI00214BB0A4|nr:DUF4041 domain-containing protein [Actinomyces wuliandei]